MNLMPFRSRLPALLVVLCFSAPLSACIWEGRSGLDASVFEAFEFDKFQRAVDGWCQNADDQAIIGDPDYDFEAVVEGCSWECFLGGDIGPCTTACVVADTGMSTECADCYGESTACTAEHCINDCLDEVSEACLACRDQHCTPAFEACTGDHG